MCIDVVYKKYVEDGDAPERLMNTKRTLLISKKHKNEAEQSERQKLQEQENGNRETTMASLNVDFSGSTLFPWQQLKQAYVCAHRATVDGQRDTCLHSALDTDHENVASHY